MRYSRFSALVLAVIVLTVIGGCARLICDSPDSPGLKEVLARAFKEQLAECFHGLIVHDGRYIVAKATAAPCEDERPPGTEETSRERQWLSSYDEWLYESQNVSLLVDELCQQHHEYSIFIVVPLGEGQEETLAIVLAAMEKCQRQYVVYPDHEAPWELDAPPIRDVEDSRDP